MIRGLEHLSCEDRLRELGLLRRREGSGVTLEQLPVPGGATGRMERGFAQGGAVIGPGGTALS